MILQRQQNLQNATDWRRTSCTCVNCQTGWIGILPCGQWAIRTEMNEDMMKAGTWADEEICCNDCICAYPSCTVAVERARLLYRILHTSGIDVSKEIKAMW